MPSDVFFDTWAWWEYLGGTKVGQSLGRKYLRNPGRRVHSSVLTLAEVSGKLASRGQPGRTRGALARIEGRSVVHTIPREIIEGSGALRSELRRTAPDASIIDALILGTARQLRLPLVSGDSAFTGQSDVRAA